MQGNGIPPAECTRNADCRKHPKEVAASAVIGSHVFQTLCVQTDVKIYFSELLSIHKLS